MDWIINHLSAYWDVMVGEMIMGGIVMLVFIVLFIIYVIIAGVRG